MIARRADPKTEPGWWLYRQLMTLSAVLLTVGIVAAVVGLAVSAGPLHDIAVAVYGPAALALIVTWAVRLGMDEWSDHQFRKNGRL